MTTYALLVRESSNRVFGESAPALAAAEVEAIQAHLSSRVENIRVADIKGLPFVQFECDELDETDLFISSNLALARGVFELLAGGALRPLDRAALEFFDSDLITIQRYQGKTNEQFTHLLVNAALAESASAHAKAKGGERVRLLDPVAGRGSTLNRGLVYGFDVAGIEVDQSHVEQYKGFISTYLKDHRMKHKVTSEKIRNGDLAGSSAFEVRLGRDATGKVPQIRVVRAATELSAAAFSKKAFDLVVGDLPYGIQHRAKASKDSSNDDIAQLVSQSLPAWKAVLADGGSIGLSWNVKTVSRDTLVAIFAEHGLTAVDQDHSFEHVVDRQITRDILISR